VIKKALSLSVLEQGLLSAPNMVVGSLLIRSMTPEEFNTYSVVLAVCLALLSAQGALVGVLSVLRPAVQRNFVQIWRQHSRWMVFGAVLNEILARAYVFVVAGAFGTAAVGTLQVAEILFRPLVPVMLGWRRVAQFHFARLYGRGDLQAAHKIAHVSAAASVVLNVCLMIGIWVAWSPIATRIFHGSYPGIETVVPLWGLVTATGCLRDIYSCELIGFAKFRELSLSGIAGALVFFFYLPVSIVAEDYQTIILANVPAHLCQLGIIIIILLRIVTFSAARPRPDAQGRAVAVGQV
jgi:O-antigen/teichoic acid export membrane protein